jgi:hypothetical protein
MSDIFVKFSYGCKNILFDLITINEAFFIILNIGRFTLKKHYMAVFLKKSLFGELLKQTFAEAIWLESVKMLLISTTSLLPLTAIT